MRGHFQVKRGAHTHTHTFFAPCLSFTPSPPLHPLSIWLHPTSPLEQTRAFDWTPGDELPLHPTEFKMKDNGWASGDRQNPIFKPTVLPPARCVCARVLALLTISPYHQTEEHSPVHRLYRVRRMHACEKKNCVCVCFGRRMYQSEWNLVLPKKGPKAARRK